MGHEATIHTRKGDDQQPAPRPLQLDRDRLRREAAAVVRRLFPVDALPDNSSRYSISRGRNGHETNAVYRLVLWFCEARGVGRPEAALEEVIAFLITVKETLYGDVRVPWAEASVREQIVDGEEDVLQVRAMHEPAVLGTYIERAEHAMAQLQFSIAAARRKVHRRRRAA